MCWIKIHRLFGVKVLPFTVVSYTANEVFRDSLTPNKLDFVVLLHQK